VATHPILNKMEEYTRELKSQNYLAKYAPGKHPNQVAVPGIVPTYVGDSKKCQRCHKAAYAVWEKSKHAHAFDTLLKPPSGPANRQYDGECIVCHTVGFGYESGYRNERETPHLKNVGCESCHGPASEHLKKPYDKRWHPLLNPWHAPANETPAMKQRRQLRIGEFCQQCHDIDNDVKYKFELRWPPIAH